MEVRTKALGVKIVDEKHTLEIPEGLFGFENYKKFALIESGYEPFIWLQSLDEESLAFLLVDPFLICTDYEADIDDESLKKIGISSPEEVIVMSVVTIPSDGKAITANLQGPLIINKKNRKAAQVILTDNRWSTKFAITGGKEEKSC